MKKIVVLFIACLLVFCGCSEAETTATETEHVCTVPVTERVCTVTFDTQGGSAIESQAVSWGEKANEPPAPTKECLCEFDGWYLGDEKWSFIGYSVTEDMTLTAKWIKCHGMNETEIEILKGFVLSKYDGEKSWDDIESVHKERSTDFDCYDYTITFKDGKSFIGSIWCEGVDE